MTDNLQTMIGGVISALLGTVSMVVVPGELGLWIATFFFGVAGGMITQLYKSVHHEPPLSVQIADYAVSGFAGFAASLLGVQSVAWIINWAIINFLPEDAHDSFKIEPGLGHVVFMAVIFGMLGVWAYRKFIYDRFYGSTSKSAPSGKPPGPANE